MDSVLSFIESQNEQQSAIMMMLHRLITAHPKMQYKISYKIPMYSLKKWVCYVNPIKKGGVEVVFVRATELSNESGILDFKKRKWMAGITYQHVEDIDELVLNEVLQEAFLLDETVPYKPIPQKEKLSKRKGKK